MAGRETGRPSFQPFTEIARFLFFRSCVARLSAPRFFVVTTVLAALPLSPALAFLPAGFAFASFFFLTVGFAVVSFDVEVVVVGVPAMTARQASLSCACFSVRQASTF